MKTGFRPERSFLDDDPEVIKETIKAYLKKWGKIGLALLIPGLVALYFVLDLHWFDPHKTYFDRLVESHPALARPYIATQKAKTVGHPDSTAYHNRLMRELRQTGPIPPIDQPLLKQYTQIKPGEQIKITMKVFASVAAERYWGPRFVRRTGSNWALMVTPVYDEDDGSLYYNMDLHLLANDPRARRGYSLFIPLN